MIPEKLKNIIEAVLLSAEHPMSVQQLESLFMGDIDCPSRDDVRKALHDLDEDCANRGFEIKQVASGFRLQVKQEFATWVGRLWEEKPARYSRALLETIALVAYRQPITRGEIEDVRGVSVSSNIIKTLVEREWVKVLGHKDVPGKPALYGTTREFLDYFNLKSLDELPTLAEIKDLDKLHPELALDDNTDSGDATETTPDAIDVVEPVEAKSSESVPTETNSEETAELEAKHDGAGDDEANSDYDDAAEATAESSVTSH